MNSYWKQLHVRISYFSKLLSTYRIANNILVIWERFGDGENVAVAGGGNVGGVAVDWAEIGFALAVTGGGNVGCVGGGWDDFADAATGGSRALRVVWLLSTPSYMVYKQQ